MSVALVKGVQSRTGGWIGTGFTALLAAAVSTFDGFVLLDHDIGALWAWLQIPVVLLAWIAPVAWRKGRWILVAVCLLASLVAPWGFFYLAPALALVLTGVAICRAIRSRAMRP